MISNSIPKPGSRKRTDADAARRIESARSRITGQERTAIRSPRSLAVVVIVLPFFRLVHFPLPSPIHVPLNPQEHILSAENSVQVYSRRHRNSLRLHEEFQNRRIKISGGYGAVTHGPSSCAQIYGDLAHKLGCKKSPVVLSPSLPFSLHLGPLLVLRSRSLTDIILSQFDPAATTAKTRPTKCSQSKRERADGQLL